MPPAFKVGDVVMLKSGGPLMTINHIGNDSVGRVRVWCDWFDGKKPASASFPPDALELEASDRN